MRLSRALAVALFLVLLLSPRSVAQKTDAVSKITALEHKWCDAYKQRDVGAMNSILADDFIITVEDGSTYGKSGYIAHSSDTSTKVEVSEMVEVRVRVRGSVAIATGAYHEKGTTKGKPYEYHDRFTDTWMNIDGQWQVLASHYSIPVK
jgi:ketosteroid isomerase-like protein